MASVCFQVLSTGSIRAEMFTIGAYFAREGAALSLHIGHSGYMPTDRNEGVLEWLDNGTEEFLIQCDDDMLPPLDILNMARDGDLISCVYLCSNDKGPMVAAKGKNRPCACGGGGCDNCDHSGVDVERVFPGEGRVEVDWFGTGCYAISRRCATDLIDRQGHVFRFFMDERGRKKEGVDVDMCRQARRLGYTPILDRNYIAGHAKGGMTMAPAKNGQLLLLPWGTFWRGNDVPASFAERKPMPDIIRSIVGSTAESS